jgi:hypothetical protein
MRDSARLDSPSAQAIDQAGSWIVGIGVFLLLTIYANANWMLAGAITYGAVFGARKVFLEPIALRVAEYELNHRRCPHGMSGGETRSLCAECKVEREANQRELERRRLAAEHRARLDKQARELERSELSRLRAERGKTLQGFLSLSPSAFEDEVARLYRLLGYEVVQTPYVNDRGRDAIATRDGSTFLIECKRYDPERGIGRRDLQIFYAAITEAQAVGGFFVTTAKAKATAAEFVQGKQIEIVDGNRLVGLARQLYGEQRHSTSYRIMCAECGEVHWCELSESPARVRCSEGHDIRSAITEFRIRDGDKAQVCPECGSSLRIVKGRRGRFLGCSGYPSCRYTREAKQK